MKIAVLGGGGAMGGLFGGYLARAGEDVVLMDVQKAAVDAINRDGLVDRGAGRFRDQGERCRFDRPASGRSGRSDH